MYKGLEKFLKEESYLNSDGEISKDYTFYKEDIDLDKDMVEVELSKELIRRLSRNKSDASEIFVRAEKFLTAVQEYENLRENFESGDFLRHVYLIKLKEEVRELMEREGYFPLLW
jgi:hypothetical protein